MKNNGMVNFLMALWNNGRPANLVQYTLATLPTVKIGGLIFVSDAGGGVGTVCFGGHSGPPFEPAWIDMLTGIDVLELIPDPEFDDASKWSIAQLIPPTIPAGTAVLGGKLLVGTDLIPPSLILGNSITTLNPSLAAEIGNQYQYEVNIPVFVSATNALVRFGGETIWSFGQGAGIFNGTVTASTTDAFSIIGQAAGFEVERVSIKPVL